MQPEALMTIYFHYGFGGSQLILLRKVAHFAISFIHMRHWYHL